MSDKKDGHLSKPSDTTENQKALFSKQLKELQALFETDYIKDHFEDEWIDIDDLTLDDTSDIN